MAQLLASDPQTVTLSKINLFVSAATKPERLPEEVRSAEGIAIGRGGALRERAYLSGKQRLVPQLLARSSAIVFICLLLFVRAVSCCVSVCSFVERDESMTIDKEGTVQRWTSEPHCCSAKKVDGNQLQWQWHCAMLRRWTSEPHCCSTKKVDDNQQWQWQWGR